jgi:tetratricopeptide (TPR) repeat protein
MRPHTALSLVLIASLSLGGGGAPIVLAASGGRIEIAVGQAQDFSHIVFRGAAPRAARREGADLVLTFGVGEPPDLGELKAAPPKFLKTVAATTHAGGVELRLTLAEGTEVKIGRADDSTYVNLSAPPAAPAAPASADQKPETRPDPTPPSGEIKMRAELQDNRLVLHFPWRAPLGAAVFRRGDAIWLVFDAKAKVDLSEAPHGLPQASRMDQAPADNATAIRITAPQTILPSLSVDGGVWTLALGPTSGQAPAPVEVKTDLSSTPSSLTAQLAGATGVFWIADPMVGDRLAVVTALGPPKGVLVERNLVDGIILESVQGLAVEPRVDDLKIATDGDIVRIGRPQGLQISPASSLTRGAAPGGADLPQRTSMPALIDFDNWSKFGSGGFLARYDQLLSGAAAEIDKGKTAGVQARLGLARFLVGSELAFEAIGVLNSLAQTNPLMLQDPEFRGLRGAARVIAGRYKDAEADFSSPTVSQDPASALWRSYISNKLGDVAGARQQFATGRAALALFNLKWRARFLRSDAEASLAAGDLSAARLDLLSLSTNGLEPVEQQAVDFDRARLMQASGQVMPALTLYQQVAGSSYGGISAPAILHATEIQLGLGRIKPADAIATLDSLRFRWRGDDTELETVRALARIYLSAGRYRDAMDALRSAARSLSDLPAASAVQADLSTAFQDLFLRGGADGLPPIQALGLFLDYKDLTPIGADGDLMVRKLARRLVDVDLLDQAAQLLKYQADNRLDGVARASVDTDLAMIQLMNRQPEAALDAINNSRSTLLPKDMAERRRVLQARALAGLGRFDDAQELLERDTSPDAVDVRSEIAWSQRDWPKAGAILEGRLGDRWKSSQPLNVEEQALLLRAGIAYSLADDNVSLGRLRSHYASLADAAPNPNALKVALAGVGAGPYTATEYVRAISDSDTFAGWVTAMKARYMKDSLKG